MKLLYKVILRSDVSMSGHEPDFKEILDALQDFRLMQARNSKVYVQLMVDICVAINDCSLGELQDLDAEELKSQSGHLLYYQIKGVAEPIPCDVDYVTQLNSHFRKPTVLVMRRIQKYLCASHRRVLGKLEREQAMERIVHVNEFDINSKVYSTMQEMNRYEVMAGLVRGGGRKLDILMHAAQVPNRAHFELLTIDRILRDSHHQRHQEALKIIEQSKQIRNLGAVQGLIQNAFQMFDSAAAQVLKNIEDLAGIELGVDSSKFDLQRSWFSLGQSLPRGEEFLKTFTSEDGVVRKIKRLTYNMVRVGWDVERLQVARDRVLVEVNLAKIQGTQLANLIFKIEEKLEGSSKPDGEVALAIETDFEYGLLSEREKQDAFTWAQENKLKLQDLMLETYQNLLDIKEKNPRIILPEELDSVIERLKQSDEGERESRRVAFQSELDQTSIEDLLIQANALKQRMHEPSSNLLAQLALAHRKILQRISKISINNIAFHRKVRDIFENMNDYETKVLELYKMEEQLENLRLDIENWMVSCYRQVPYVSVPERVLAQCLEVIEAQLYQGLKRMDFQYMDADMLSEVFEQSTALSDRDCMLHLDQLLQECLAIPTANQCLELLKDWDKDLGKERIKESELYILENNDKIQELTNRTRAELREQINTLGTKGLSRRLRFEIFDLADYYAGSLEKLLTDLEPAIKRLAQVDDGEDVLSNLAALESQIIEAQRATRPSSDVLARLTSLGSNHYLSNEVIGEMEHDLEINFKDLDLLLVDVGSAMKRVKLIQNKHGAEKDLEHLDVTVNVRDIECLKDVYNFVESVTLEEIKHFCAAYNLKTAMLDELLRKARKKDISVPEEIRQHLNRKAYKMFLENRYLPLILKTVIFKNDRDIFDAECQLLCHTLCLVDSLELRKKASYKGIIAILAQVKQGDPQITKMLRLMWGRLQKRMFDFQPAHHVKNFETNRQALMTDCKEAIEASP